MLDLTEDRSLERISSALLQRAMREGAQSNASSLNRPFFRLHPEERLVLSSLHLGHWSYERLGRVLNRTPEEIGTLAWSVRQRLAMRAQIGSDVSAVSCPEYHPENPWTQRFLDNEMMNRERIFLQTHVMACERCRETLSRSRDIYYRVDSLIPRPDHDLHRMRALESAMNQARLLTHRSDITFLESVVALAKRRDVWLVLGAVLVFGLFRLFQ